MKRIRSAFVTGLLVLLPVVATIDIFLWFVSSVDRSARYVLPTQALPFDFWGLGLVVAVLLILVVGLLTQNYIGKFLVSFFDSLILRITFVGGVYGGIKKVLETVFNPSSDKFKEVVLVEFPRAGCWTIAFRTGRPDERLTKGLDDARLVNVFIPCTPNPTAGFYLLVPESELRPLDMTVQEAFKTVISLGIVGGDTPPPPKSIGGDSEL